MNLSIFTTESVSTNDSLRLPNSNAIKIGQYKVTGNIRLPEFSINVPEDVNIMDNLGTYKPWFNGMKHFYTVKPLPPTKQ
jgi:hypothetical protein